MDGSFLALGGLEILQRFRLAVDLQHLSALLRPLGLLPLLVRVVLEPLLGLLLGPLVLGLLPAAPVPGNRQRPQQRQRILVVAPVSTTDPRSLRRATLPLLLLRKLALEALLPPLLPRELLVVHVRLLDARGLALDELLAQLLRGALLLEVVLVLQLVDLVRVAVLVEDELRAATLELEHLLLGRERLLAPLRIDDELLVAVRDDLGLGPRGVSGLGVEGVVVEHALDGEEVVLVVVVDCGPGDFAVGDELGVVAGEDVLVGALEHAVIFRADLLLLGLLGRVRVGVLFVGGHAGARRVLDLLGVLALAQLDLRRSGESQAGGVGVDVELVELEDLLVLLEMHGADVADEGLLAEVLEVWVLEAHALQLVRDALLLALLDGDLVDGHLLGLEALDHASLLAGVEEEHGLAVALVAGRAADAVDVGVGVLGAVDLDDPVDGGEVDAARDDVGGEEAGVVRLGEAFRDLHALQLLLLAEEVEEGDTGLQVSEGLVGEADLLAGGEEDDDLGAEVGLDEAVEGVELLGERGDDVVLLQVLRGGLLVDGDVLGFLEGEAGEVGDLLALGGAEEEGLAGLGQVLDEGVDGGLEAHVHDAVGLVEDEDLEVVDVEAGGLVEVLQHAAGRADEDVHLGQTLGLLLEALAADNEAGGEGVVAADLAQDVKDLRGELAGRGDDEGAEAVELGPSRAVELLENGDDEGEGLAGAGLCGAEDVVTLEGEGHGAGLDVGEGLEVGFLEACGGRFAEGEFGKGCEFALGVLYAGEVSVSGSHD
ncbi:ATP-dependent RNA helicase dbp4 [Colletotrichum asianum]